MKAFLSLALLLLSCCHTTAAFLHHHQQQQQGLRRHNKNLADLKSSQQQRRPARAVTTHLATTATATVAADTATTDVRPPLAALLSLSYMSIILSITTMPVCLKAMGADAAFVGGSNMPKLLAVATMATCGGKFILGPATDRVGGEATLVITMAVVAATLVACSLAPSLHVFGHLWVWLSFVYAAAWGAVGKIVRERFVESAWSTQLGWVAAGSRIGSLSSALLFGEVLKRTTGGVGWRRVFQVGATVQATVLALYVLLSRRHHHHHQHGTATRSRTNTEPASASASVESAPAMISRVSSNPAFWSMLAGKSALMCVGQFISFMPLYLTLYMPAPQAATASCAFAVGSLLATLTLSKAYQAMSNGDKVAAVAASNVLNCLVPGALWAHQVGMLHLPAPAVTVPALLVAYGAAWFLPFYIPPGVLALQLGGAGHAALLTNIFDAAGFSAASVLSFYAMKLGAEGRWAPVLGSLSAGGGVALLCMFVAMRVAAR